MMGYVPNYDAMLYFIEEIFPIIQQKRPSVRLRIVGKNPPEILKKKRNQHIEITGFVSDVRPYIQQSDLYVVPLRMGGGTRLKILQAMAMKIPIISTTIGAEGLEAVDGDHLLLRDDPQSFAEATLELMDHSTLKKQLAESAYQFVREEYDWKTIGGRIDAAFHYLMQQKNGRVATALLKRQA
jgi:glycosyltransferase involved in cell wall biosynthesis